jgi:hypothetical protein
VKDTCGVRGRQRVGDTGHQREDLRPGALLVGRPIPQRSAIHQFGDEIRPSLPFPELEHAHDVRVVERRRRARLTMKPVERDVGEVSRKKLDGDGTVQLRIARHVHLSHAA